MIEQTTTALPGFAMENDLASCTACTTALPLRRASSSEQPVEWECARCGAKLTGVLNEHAHEDIRFNVYPSHVSFTCASFEQSPQRIDAFANQMAPTLSGEQEKRQSERKSLCLAAAAMPMDDNRKTKDVAFMVLVQNVSVGGIAFTHMQPIKEPYVALELWAPSGERMKVIVRVLRTRAVGQFYEIAGEFVTD